MEIKSAWYFQSTSRQAIIEDRNEALWLVSIDDSSHAREPMIPYCGPDPRVVPEYFTPISSKELRMLFQLEFIQQQEEEKEKEEELELEL